MSLLVSKIASRDCVVAQSVPPVELAFCIYNLNRKAVNSMQYVCLII